MYKAFLALRYLKTRYIALASIISVMLGVATMIVVNSVMTGFTFEMKDRIKGILADIVIESNSLDGQQNAQGHFDRVRSVVGDKVAGITATVEMWGLLAFNFQGQYQIKPITLIGIEPEGKASVGPLVEYLESYHEVREGGELIRAPLRSRDVTPSWELTSEGAEWRKRSVELQKAFERQPTHSPPTESETTSELRPAHRAQPDAQAAHDEPPPFEEAPTAGKPSPAAKSASPNLLAAVAEVAGGSQDSPLPQVMPAKAEAAADDPFANPGATPKFMVPENSEAAAPIDESQPLRARVYVGKNLISFPVEDPHTGKTRTIEMVRPGNDVKISTVKAGIPPDPAYFNATVVDVFKCGMSEYDSSLVFCNLEELQRVRQMLNPSSPDDPAQKSITSIQIKLKDYADASEVVEQLKTVFPPRFYTIRTWEQKQGPLLAAVEIETGILNVLLFLIIAVAGFGILAIFYMIVVEKTRDIGILKALGAGSGGVMSIFLSYGLALGIVGSGVGVMMGLLFVHYINEIEALIAAVTGRKVFDDKIYYFPRIPTLVQPSMVVWVTLGAIAIAVLASVLPARRAARLRPVESLRYE